jgi:hypothetical protein
MHRSGESHAQKFMERAREANRCVWCARAKPKNRKGLCRHCEKIRRKIEKLEMLPPGSFMLDWELRVARAEKEGCIVWGGMPNGILGEVTPLDLEHWFCMLAKRIARDRRMHSNSATMLGWTFTPEQRQVLAYMFWQVFGEEASHHGKGRALHGTVGSK